MNFKNIKIKKKIDLSEDNNKINKISTRLSLKDE
jgi:hypothetical protein